MDLIQLVHLGNTLLISNTFINNEYSTIYKSRKIDTTPCSISPGAEF